jgi:uncharacterized protein
MSSGHIQTIYHSEFRRVDGVKYTREKIDTPDGDFLNIDWLRSGSRKIVLLLHGLESDTTRSYMKGMVKALSSRGFDCAALNFRSCGGEMNRTNFFYNAGNTSDTDFVIRHIEKLPYDQIYLFGSSLGGNVTLKYIGEKGKNISKKIVRAAAISAPCDLSDSSKALERKSNLIYNRRFVKKLLRKVKAKLAVQPGSLDAGRIRFVRSLRDYDDHFTAPMFGYRDAQDYYTHESSFPLLQHIAIPTLLINAKDDPFLSGKCFPVDEAERSNRFFFEDPAHGGHLGFLSNDRKGEYWHETRVAEFLLKGFL